jgi:hypothetical protein
MKEHDTTVLEGDNPVQLASFFERVPPLPEMESLDYE